MQGEKVRFAMVGLGDIIPQIVVPPAPERSELVERVSSEREKVSELGNAHEAYCKLERELRIASGDEEEGAR
jgi:hypothetical protein